MHESRDRARRRDGRAASRAAIACIGLLVAGALLIGAGICGFGHPFASEEAGGPAGEGVDAAAAQATNVADEDVELFSDGTLEERRNAYIACDDLSGASESVTTVDEAADVLEATFAGVDESVAFDAGGAVTQEASGMRFYRFQQVYQGIPVYGRGAAVIVTATGEPVGISSNAIAIGGLETTPALSADDACRAARAWAASDADGDPTSGIAADDPRLVVYSIGCDPALAYLVRTEGVTGADEAEEASSATIAACQVVIDAQNGSPLASLPTTLDAATSAEGQLGHVYDNLDLDGPDSSTGRFYLHDSGRNISVYSLGYTQGIRDIRSQTSREVADTGCDSGVDAIGNLTAIENFYDRRLGWEGLDGKGYAHKALDAYVEIKGSYNAGWSNSDEMMLFMGTDALGVQMSAYFDVVAHEFTHAVTQHTSDLASSQGQRESYDAINEALSDILSEAAERDLDGRCDWRFGPAGASWSRDFTQGRQQLVSGADCHVNAVVLDNIAYLIAEGQDIDGYTKEQTGFFSESAGSGSAAGEGADHLGQYATFWHRVQMGVPSTCTYQQLATVALGIADAMCTNGEITSAQYRGIVAAFASKGIVDDGSWRDRHKSDPAPEPSGQEDGAAAMTVLAIDTSGSMHEAAGSPAEGQQVVEQDVTKMERACEATRTLLSVLEAANEAEAPSEASGNESGDADGRPDASSAADYSGEGASGSAHSACLVGFATEAEILAPATSSAADVATPLDTLEPGGETDIASALRTSIDACADFEGDRSVVLLTDGKDTEGNSEEQLVALAHEAAQRGIKVSTVGFGMRGSLDEGLLRAIANAGGGTYRYADPDDELSLAASLLADQAESDGTVLAERRGATGAGEPGAGEMTSFEVGGEGGELSVVVAGPEAGTGLGTDAEASDGMLAAPKVVLTDPQGRAVGEGYPGARVADARTATLLTVADPAPGVWHAVVYAADDTSAADADDGEATVMGPAVGSATPYYLLASAKAKPAQGLAAEGLLADAAVGPRTTLAGLALAAGVMLVLAALYGTRALASRRQPRDVPRD